MSEEPRCTDQYQRQASDELPVQTEYGDIAITRALADESALKTSTTP